MHTPESSARVLVVSCLVAAFVAAGARSARAAEWVGGHGDNWSEPLNWLGTVPTSGQPVILRLNATVPAYIFQDLTGGAVVSSVTSFRGNSSAPSFLIEGNPIDLSAGGNVTYVPGGGSSTHTPVVFRAPVRLLGATTFSAAAQFSAAGKGNYANLFHNVTGSGSVTTSGDSSHIADSVILSASYTGTTTVRSGMLRLGGAVGPFFAQTFHQANTTNQGDYLVMSGASLTGMGTIGLAPGRTVTVAGTIVPGSGGFLGLGEDGGVDLRINGDLVLDDGGTYTANWLGRFSNLIVNGTADLRGVGDRLSTTGPLNFLTPGTYVVMEYQNRLGSFDILPMSHVANVIYTSAENSGPGQVLIQVPEPSFLTCTVAVLLLAARRRSPSSHARA